MLDIEKEQKIGKQNRFKEWMEGVKRLARKYDTDEAAVFIAMEMVLDPSNDEAIPSFGLADLLRWKEARDFFFMATSRDE